MLAGVLAVTYSASAGSVAWRVSTAGVSSDFEPALGPDGTVYTGNGGAVTAVAPDGSVRWSVPATARQGEVAVGADGTVYAVTGITSIVALDPADGSPRWTFDGGDNIVAGPDVGPDGNVYAVADTEFGGLGLFSLTSQGVLRFNEAGDPALSEQSGLGHRLEFGDDRVFMAMVPGPTGGAPWLWAFDLDGDQQYVLGTGCEGQPLADDLGRLVTGNGNCQRILAHDAAGGGVLVNEPAPSQSPCSGMANVAVGPDGAMYTAFCYRAFWSVNADGSQRWFDDDFGTYFWMDNLAVVPDNSALLDLGRNASAQGRVRAFSTADGSLLWQIDLPSEAGLNISSVTRPVFDMSRNRAYFNARHGTTESFLYAIDLVPPPAIPGDANGDGIVNFGDVLAVIAAWGPCAGACPEDLNADGTVSFADVLVIIANWSP
jgi:outer membrane protein assembly factor BamB